MDSRQGLPPDQRYLKIADDKEKRERDTEDEKNSRHNHIHNVAKEVLPVFLDDGFRRSTWNDRRNSKRVPKLDLGGVMSRVCPPATPPTPPMSPVQSRTRNRGAPHPPQLRLRDPKKSKTCGAPLQSTSLRLTHLPSHRKISKMKPSAFVTSAGKRLKSACVRSARTMKRRLKDAGKGKRD